MSTSRALRKLSKSIPPLSDECNIEYREDCINAKIVNDITQLMAEAKMSRAQLAKATNISLTKIHRLLNESNLFTIHYLVTITHALNKKVSIQLT